MFITILAHIIVILGVAALAALIVYVAFLTLKKAISIIKEKLSAKYGGTVVALSMERVVGEAMKEAKEQGNVIKIEQLEEMANKSGVAFAVADENGKIDNNSIEIFQTDELESEVTDMLGPNGCLVISA